MKHLLILIVSLLGLFYTTNSQAQVVSQGAYRQWQYFRRDTAAYLKYNWSRLSIYNQQHKELPLKAFFNKLELPITTIEFKIIDRFIVGVIVYVMPYEQLMNTPPQSRPQFGMTVNFLPEFIVAAPYEEKLTQLKMRDKTKVDRIFVKWDPSYNKIIEDLKYDYIVY